MVTRFLPVVILLLSCGAPSTQALGLPGCDALAGTEREDCRFDEAKAIQDPAALDAALKTIEDPLARDLLLVRLAFDAPASSATFCGRVTTAIGKQRCQQIVGRPHLRGGS